MTSNVLVGKTITAVHLAEDGSAIRFTVNGEFVEARVGADCCSHTWIESIDAPEAMIGTVLSVEEIDMPWLGTGPEQTDEKDRGYNADCLSYYGCKITTDKGFCVIDYRNESNGYYGGSLDWPGSACWNEQGVADVQWRLVAGGAK